MDQAVKYIEDMQDEFDLRYKTLQSRGNLWYKDTHMHMHTHTLFKISFLYTDVNVRM